MVGGLLEGVDVPLAAVKGVDVPYKEGDLEGPPEVILRNNIFGCKFFRRREIENVREGEKRL